MEYNKNEDLRINITLKGYKKRFEDLKNQIETEIKTDDLKLPQTVRILINEAIEARKK